MSKHKRDDVGMHFYGRCAFCGHRFSDRDRTLGHTAACDYGERCHPVCPSPSERNVQRAGDAIVF